MAEMCARRANFTSATRTSTLPPVPRRKNTIARSKPGYDAVLADIVGLLDAARRSSARAVNAIMTATYWAVGRRIVEHEQLGEERAGYGEDLLGRLARDLGARFGRGFGRTNLFQMRSFYLAYREPQLSPRKIQTVSEFFADAPSVADLAPRFPLPWSHYVRLISLRNAEARAFYEAEAMRGGWSGRQLERQIDSQFYERTALSRCGAQGPATR